MARRKIGLALGGGAARGMAHIGVLAVLEQAGIPVDIIAGTSAGAAVGALYARGKSSIFLRQKAISLSRKKMIHFIDPSLPRSGFIRGERVKELLTGTFGGDIQFSDLKRPFACVAADIETGEELVLDSGSVAEAVRASISLPAIFTLVAHNGRYLVDGGLVNPVPVSVLQRMGADFIIAVNVIPDMTDRTPAARKKPASHTREPGIIFVLLQSTFIATHALARSSMEHADIIIEPQVAHIHASDFHHTPECIREGELAAKAALPEIKRLLVRRRFPVFGLKV